MKRSIIFFVSMLIVVGGFSATIAEAQNSVVIESLEVSLWPDYDQYAILVIYRVHLATDTTLPIKVQLPIPAVVGDPYATAWMREDGRLIVADYTNEVQGDWNVVTLTSGSLIAQLEFYMEYELSGVNRNVVFEWPEGFAVEEFSYDVQKPTAVEDLQIIPSPDDSFTGNDGLLHHQANLGEVSEDQTVRIELSYSNPSNQLTIDESITPEPLPLSRPVEAEGGTPDVSQILPWFLGGLGICLVVVSGILYFQSRRHPQKAKRKPRIRKPAKLYDEGNGAEVDPSTIYCHQCGTKANVSDRYCRHCGVPLRR
jgi:hypothetical protein